MTRDAYDVVHDLYEAGTTLYVRNGQRITWECDRKRPVPKAALSELARHKEDIIAIMLDVPDGCPVPHICRRLGICHREIRESACTLAAASLVESGEAA